MVDDTVREIVKFLQHDAIKEHSVETKNVRLKIYQLAAAIKEHMLRIKKLLDEVNHIHENEDTIIEAMDELLKFSTDIKREIQS